MKLEAKHLAPYLPYNLQVEYRGKATTLDALDSTGGAFVGENRMVSFVDQRHIKPILRPLPSMTEKEAYDLLSLVVFDLTVDIEDMENLIIERDFIDITIKCTFKNSIYYDTLFSLYISGESILYTSTDHDGEEPLLTSYSMYEHLFFNHFDVFNLIDKGLAIAK